MIKSMLHFEVSDNLNDVDDITNAIRHEAILNCSVGKWSSMVCIPALASVMKSSIKSVYSLRSCHKFFDLFTRTFGPQEESPSKVMVLLWSTTGPSNSYTKPNHFVTCMNPSQFQKVVIPLKNISSLVKLPTLKSEKRKKQSTLSFQPAKKLSMEGNINEVTVTSNNVISSGETFTAINTISAGTTSNVVKDMRDTKCDIVLHKTLSSLHVTKLKVEKLETSSSENRHILSAEESVAEDTSCLTDPVKKLNNPPPSSQQKARGAKTCQEHCCTGNLPARGKPVKTQAECHPNDVGLNYQKVKGMPDLEKYNFLKNVWKPPLGYSYPQHVESNRHWRFNSVYADPNSSFYMPWLVYSAYFDGTFCLPCIAFGHSFADTKLKKLFKEPFTRWNGARKRWVEHQTSSPVHKNALGAMHTFINQMEGTEKRVGDILKERTRENIRKNREKLIPIIKTVVLCGRQNIPLRGHRDDSKHLSDPSINPGNFQTLLDFRVDGGDKVLEQHFETAPRNATYRSKTIQNELILCCGKYIRTSIVDEVKKARFFSIMADEASDCSQIEQLSLIIRFIDQRSEIREEFIEFIDCESVSSASLTSYLKKSLQKLSLDISDLRGQAYDGAGNMAGSRSGVSTRILAENPKALYFHCSSHRLNLAVASCSKIRSVKKMMDAMKKCSDIFHFSPKKQELLKGTINREMPEDKRSTLLDVCRTRWIQRIDGLERIQELIDPILITLEMISDNFDGSYSHDARSDAQGVFHTMKSFFFAVNLIIVRSVLSYTLPLTYQLQKKQIDVLTVYHAVDNVIETLEDCRCNVDLKHDEWYDEAVKFSAGHLDAVHTVRRIAGQQTLRENYATSTPSEHYKVSLTIPLLDQIITELKGRFSRDHRIHANGYFIIPSVVLSNVNWKQHICEFVKNYESDLPQILHLKAELESWNIFWINEQLQKHTIPDNIEAALTSIDSKKHWFPNIYVILCLIAVVPASSNSCERSISKLRNIKTYLRSTMSQGRLSSLALLSIHRDISIDFHEVLNIFARDHPCRLQLVNILNTDN